MSGCTRVAAGLRSLQEGSAPAGRGLEWTLGVGLSSSGTERRGQSVAQVEERTARGGVTEPELEVPGRARRDVASGRQVVVVDRLDRDTERVDLHDRQAEELAADALEAVSEDALALRGSVVEEAVLVGGAAGG